jgi:signal transduction histidine kinase
MKSYNRILIAVVVTLIAIFTFCNLYIYSFDSNNSSGKQYRVEAQRVVNQIEREGYSKIDLSQYSTITAVDVMGSKDDKSFFETDSDYLIRKINGEFYRIEYSLQDNHWEYGIIGIMNFFLVVMAVMVIAIMLFIRQKVLKPFDELKEVPYELARGNLTVPVKEGKSKFFSKFAWGVDLLRENIEQQKQKELSLQKEKKTLVLSISHDIKTPLSAIKLYAKALSKGLYKDKERQTEIFDNIHTKAVEIENFVNEIIKASSEEFLNLEVAIGEFYLSQAVEKISDYYCGKLELVKTGFMIGEYSNCILKGDLDRLVEVLQNVIENAIKYGDGYSIEISFTKEEDCRLITVRNSGCTLPKTELPHVFESFWRGSNAGNKSGSGLGLYICRQLMHKMDGDIFADIDHEMMCVTVVIREV